MRTGPLLLILLLSLPAGATPAAPTIKFNDAARKHGLVLAKLASAELDQERVKDGARHRFVSLRAHAKSLSLEVEITSPLGASEARALAEQKLNVVARLYGEQKVPYPGELSNEIACTKNRQPSRRTRSVSGLKVRMLVGHANDRFAFGACQQESIRYLGLDSFFYLPARRALVELRAFQPSEQATASELFGLLGKIEALP